jgi:hypothetical protein
MILDKVFEKLKEHNRGLTKIDFTKQYLGKSKSYWYVMKHRKQDISNDSLYIESFTVSLKNLK